MLELRQAVTRFYGREFGLDYPVESVLVAGGARPLIYATYRALVDPGEAVAYPVPSWNNNHYCYLSGACGLPIEVSRASRFHPTPAQVRSLLPRIRLLALNTPLNPTGTAIEPEALREICRDLVAENAGRHARGERPVFLMFDQVYWSLDFRRMEPVTPPGLLPEVAPYTVMLDAISKSLAATGLRVGWSVASPAVTQRMSDLLGHVGAWAPKAEQMATAEFLDEADSFGAFRLEMHRRLGSLRSLRPRRGRERDPHQRGHPPPAAPRGGRGDGAVPGVWARARRRLVPSLRRRGVDPGDRGWGGAAREPLRAGGGVRRGRGRRASSLAIPFAVVLVALTFTFTPQAAHGARFT